MDLRLQLQKWRYVSAKCREAAQTTRWRWPLPRLTVHKLRSKRSRLGMAGQRCGSLGPYDAGCKTWCSANFGGVGTFFRRIPAETRVTTRPPRRSWLC
jgi:hypothetical protein